MWCEDLVLRIKDTYSWLLGCGCGTEGKEVDVVFTKRRIEEMNIDINTRTYTSKAMV